MLGDKAYTVSGPVKQQRLWIGLQSKVLIDAAAPACAGCHGGA